MKVSEISKKLNLTTFVEGEDNDVKSAYVGDFLSFAISGQEEESIWFTVMNNVNVAGVATLAGTAMIVLCHGVTPDQNLLAKCKQVKMPLFSTEKSTYEIAVDYSKL